MSHLAHGKVPPSLRVLFSHPLELCEVALSGAVRQRCSELDDRIRQAADDLRSSRPCVDRDVLSLVRDGTLDITVPGETPPVCFPAKPSLEQALAARSKIPGCEGLSAAIAGRSLTPWTLRQVNAAAIGFRMLPLRTGSHHLAADADGIAVMFPPVDCARVLTKLCAWINGAPPLPAVAEAVVAYLQVCKLHGFRDGNGRTARALLTAILNARLVGAKDLYLPLASVIFTNAEFLSAEYRRAEDTRMLGDFISYGAALIARTLDAAIAVARSANGVSTI